MQFNPSLPSDAHGVSLTLPSSHKSLAEANRANPIDNDEEVGQQSSQAKIAALFQEALRLDPNHVRDLTEALRNYSDILRLQDNPNSEVKASAAFQDALRLHPDFDTLNCYVTLMTPVKKKIS